jgi:hypothetical protein
MDFDHSFDTITPDNQPTLNIGGTGGLVVPIGTTAQRPTATQGVIRYNTDTASLDFVVGSSYQVIRGVSALSATDISAAGTTQGTATPITAAVNNITTVSSGTGVILPVAASGDGITVFNKGANPLLVYPQIGSTIDMLAVNAGYSIAVNKAVKFRATKATQWEIQSDTGAVGGGTGTVTSLSIVSTNGLAGTVTTPTTTPAITLSTTVTGIVKGNGTSLLPATGGTDYSPGTSALTTGIIKSTTGTGFLSIAVAGDFPLLNQNTTGTASGLSSPLPLTGIATIANNTVLGNVSGSPASPIALTTAQHTTLVDIFTSTLKGTVPASGGGTTTFLRADGTWSTPAGGGGGITSEAGYAIALATKLNAFIL